MNYRFTPLSSCWVVFRSVFLFLELCLRMVSFSCPVRTSFLFPLELLLEGGLADVSLLFSYVEGFLALILRCPFLLLGFWVPHGLAFLQVLCFLSSLQDRLASCASVEAFNDHKFTSLAY